VTSLSEGNTAYRIKVFDFSHIFIKFSSEIQQKLSKVSKDNCEDVGSDLHSIYISSLQHLNLLTDPVKITKDFSVMVTEDWMLIVPRKTSEVKLQKGSLNLNSACYTLSILVKTVDLLEELKTIKLIDVFKTLGE